MSTSLDHLLPAADEALRCADHAVRIELDPGGTAIRADRVVVADLPLPWPKPALAHPRLTPLAERLASSPVPTRLLAAVPGADGPTGVVVYERRGPVAARRRYRVDGAADLAAVGAALTDDPRAADRLLVEALDEAPPTLLVCTQGSHDVCCGAEGSRLAADLEAARPRIGPSGLVVRRVSHTGGHRFAPTAMTLPDGRMWAGLDVATTLGVLDRTIDPAAAATRCRGWWGAAPGPAQVAERAVLALRGWGLDDLDRTVSAVEDDEGRWRCTIVTGDDTWTVEVTAGRTVPTITCRAVGGQPVKPALEYSVAAVAPPGGRVHHR
ncbi:MAG: sucrase ferredoxin [Acidimicrobiales bacterium]